MGWNQPNDRKTVMRRHKVISKPTVVVLLVAIVLGCVVWYYSISRGKTEFSGETERSRLIAVSEPQVQTKAEKHRTEFPVIDPNARPTKVGEIVNGYVMLPSGRIHKRQGVITNSVAMRRKPPHHIFDQPCNNEIATYLSVKPGDVLVGTRRYTGKFKQQFLDSIKDVIVISPNDTPEQAQLKKDVIAARLQLKDALDRGEDIEQIMIDTRNELQDLMRVKNSVKSIFKKEVVKCETEQDVDMMISACNQMLAEKGIAPLKCNALTRLNILRDLRDNQ